MGKMLYNVSMSEQNIQVFIPPVVAVLGHVDHGKTTLLDAIRKTSIASREHGGITQKIGASSIEITHDNHKRRLTFIDTPGHEAFTLMRGRGVQAADIVLLIVSAVDGVMPQTRESLELLREQGVPYIVVITKTDSPEKNIEKVKQQLLRENVMLENYGGDIPVIEVSSIQGTNIKELLELILLVFEVHYLQPDTTYHIGVPTENLQGIVIESKLDQKIGPKATVIIKRGTITVKDEIIAGTVEGKVRALITDLGIQLKQASVGEAIELLGFQEVPPVGTIVYNKKQLGVDLKPKQTIVASNISQSLPSQHPLFQKTKADSLSVILCADTQGSLEAIIHSLPKGLTILSQKTGEVSEDDVFMAKATGSIILAFNTKIRPDVAKIAFNEKILAKNYTIIYEMLDELTEVMENKRLALVEHIYGTAEILASFPYEKSIVLGVKITDGRLAKGDKIRLLRGEDLVGETSIVSLKQGKQTASKVEKGQDAGILISPFLDFRVGDVIISHS